MSGRDALDGAIARWSKRTLTPVRCRSGQGPWPLSLLGAVCLGGARLVAPETLDWLFGVAGLRAPDGLSGGHGLSRRLLHWQSAHRDQDDPGALDTLKHSVPVSDNCANRATSSGCTITLKVGPALRLAQRANKGLDALHEGARRDYRRGGQEAIPNRFRWLRGAKLAQRRSELPLEPVFPLEKLGF